MRRRKSSLSFLIIILVLFLGIGYAYLNTTLSINGTTDVDSNSWNVYWNNVQVTEGSVSGSQVTTTPTIDTNKTTVSFQVRLSKPGDFYEFTVDAKNDGSIDAMIDVVTKTNTLPSYLKYTVMYDDGIEIAKNDLLESNTLETYRVKVEFKEDISSNDLPATAETLNLIFGVTYVQADSSGETIRSEIFSTDSTEVYFWQSLPQITTYDDYNTAMTEFGHDYFLKHIVDRNNKVIRSDVGFKYNNNIYYVKGGGRDVIPPLYFEYNKTLMHSIFPDNICEIYTDDTGYEDLYCVVDSNLSVYIDNHGVACVYGDSGHCCVNNYGDIDGFYSECLKSFNH